MSRDILTKLFKDRIGYETTTKAMSCQCKFRNPDECMKKIHDERCR
jgi:hypothetical protein